MSEFSIVIPTLNEAENIDFLLTRLFSLNLSPHSFEVIFVDDGSNDGTPEKIRVWQNRAKKISLIERKDRPDLIASVLAGTANANNNVIVVMDADLSHPAERLPAIVSPIFDDKFDVVVGSRYVAGGSTANWPLHRQLMSRMGCWLASPLCDVSDATSGFFAFRREFALTISKKAQGYKILFELLIANKGKLRVAEVPICFSNRIHGTSKLSFIHQRTYLQRLVTLTGSAVIESRKRRDK
ncbi:MAG: polyprenol monophosphomannose synthase [Nitrosomonas sp.]|nr:polyprenol monophosphomannose synthase [Nitrosomonas sp.]